MSRNRVHLAQKLFGSSLLFFPNVLFYHKLTTQVWRWWPCGLISLYWQSWHWHVLWGVPSPIMGEFMDIMVNSSTKNMPKLLCCHKFVHFWWTDCQVRVVLAVNGWTIQHWNRGCGLGAACLATTHSGEGHLGGPALWTCWTSQLDSGDHHS